MADERRPLLSESLKDKSNGIDTYVLPADESLTPPLSPKAQFPLKQIIFVAVARCSHPLYLNIILPFINAMIVNDLKLSDELHVGHLSGFIEAVTPIAMICGLLIATPLSDKYGRKPVTLIGMTISSAFCIAFGFARNDWQLIALRALIGLFNSAQAATGKTMIAEFCDENHLARGYAIVGFGWQVASIVSPLLGGVFSAPARTWPGLFQGTLFERYPYALPGCMAALVPLGTVLCGIYHMEESHPALRKRLANYKQLADDKLNCEASVVDIDTAIRAQPSLFSCGLHYVMTIWILLIYNICTSSVAELLCYFSPRQIGGLGLHQCQMSYILAIRPLLLCAYEINVFPYLSKRFGPEVLLRVFMWGFPAHAIAFLCVAIVSLNGASKAVAMALVVTGLLVQLLCNPAFICCDMLIQARSPTAEQLSSAVALSEITAQVSWALGAFGGSSLYALGATLPIDNWLHGKVVWTLLVTTTVTAALLTSKLTHKDGYRSRTAT